MSKRFAAWMAGASVGLLLGFASGMTTARVAAILIGAVAGGLLVLLGFQKATIALAVGVTARAHDWFGQSPATAQKRWTDASFSPTQARAIVLYEKAGLMSGGAEDSGKIEEAKNANAGSGSSVLFAGRAETCGLLNPAQYSSTDELVKSLQFRDEKLQKLGAALQAIAAAQRDGLVRAIYEATCGT